MLYLNFASGNMWLLLALGLLVGSAFDNLIKTIGAITKNYRAAKKTGLPVVISPVSARNVVWLLTQKYIAPVISGAPFGLGSWARITIRGWLWSDHEKMQQTLGNVWVLASPKGLDVSQSPSLSNAHSNVVSQRGTWMSIMPLNVGTVDTELT